MKGHLERIYLIQSLDSMKITLKNIPPGEMYFEIFLCNNFLDKALFKDRSKIISGKQ